MLSQRHSDVEGSNKEETDYDATDYNRTLATDSDGSPRNNDGGDGMADAAPGLRLLQLRAACAFERLTSPSLAAARWHQRA